MNTYLNFRVLCTLLISIFFLNKGLGQQTMAIGDSNPKNNAILYLKGNGNQGLIIPIVSALGNFGEAGMVVYNSNDKKVYYHDGTNWVAIGGTGSAGDLVVGNEISQVGTNGGLTLSGSGTALSPFAVSLVSGNSDGQTLRWNATLSKWELAISSGLSSTLAASQIFVGNGSNVASAVAMSGDATINNTGVLTIAPNAVNSNKISDGSIVNADISPTAAIVPSKIAQATAVNGDVLKWNGSAWAPGSGGLSATLNSGQILVGNAANVATAATVSGDATVSNAGVLTIANSAVNSNKIADNSVMNADINAAAGINGSKVIPNFGTQNIVTTGSTSTAALTATGVVTFNALSGTGTRMVVAGPTGTLAFQSIPTTFSTLNVIPKGDGTALTSSQIFDNGNNVGIGTVAPLYKLQVEKTLASANDAQYFAYNPSNTDGDKSSIRFGVGSFWAVHLQTQLNGDWLQLTDNSGGAVHRWGYNTYYPGPGSVYVQGNGGTMSLMGGNVGIGVGAPAYPLEVNGNIKHTGNFHYFYDNKFIYHGDTYTVLNDHWIPNNNDAYDLGTSVYRWRTLYTNFNPNVSSDIRLKTNVSNLTYGLSEILRMRPVSYSFKSDKDKKTSLGLIAQEVREIIPEIVVEDSSPDKVLGLTYSDLIPVLINAVKEQQKIIDNQKAEIEKMKILLESQASKTIGESDEITKLKAEVAEIKRLLGTEAKVK